MDNTGEVVYQEMVVLLISIIQQHSILLILKSKMSGVHRHSSAVFKKMGSYNHVPMKQMGKYNNPVKRLGVNTGVGSSKNK